jgi:hypothetical protein
MEGSRHLGCCSGWYVLGNLRTSLLIGKISNPSLVLLTGPDINDELLLTVENQLGLGWTTELRRVALDLRAIWETQFWMNDTFADDFNGFGTNLGFAGPTFSVQMRY